MPDEAMLVKAGVVSNLLVNDLAVFTPKFPFIDATFHTAFMDSIDAADALRLDSEVEVAIEVETSDLTKKVLEGFAELRILDTYAKLAYLDNKIKKNVFGQSTWIAAKRNQDKMRAALEVANNRAKEEPYHSDMLAKGYTDAQIDHLLIIAAEILALNLEQKGGKSDRPVTTQERIGFYNRVWESMRLLTLCSKVVFKKNPAKLRQYMLYASRVS